MLTGINSGITEITQVDSEILDRQRERKENFEHWGATPEEARKAAVGKAKGLIDKRMTIKEAVGNPYRCGNFGNHCRPACPYVKTRHGRARKCL